MGIPERTVETIRNYVIKGWEPGAFVGSVLANDLCGAFVWADEENRQALGEIVAFVHNQCPPQCRGSQEAIDRWLLRFRREERRI